MAPAPRVRRSGSLGASRRHPALGLLLVMAAAMGCCEAWARACIIRTQVEGSDIRICQENRSIPEPLFETQFCQPDLPSQVSVEFVEHCPADTFGICQGARSAGVPFQQDIYYYGVASDARYLKPACEMQNHGLWVPGAEAVVPETAD